MDVCFVLLTRARVSLGVNDARIMMARMHGVWRRGSVHVVRSAAPATRHPRARETPGPHRRRTTAKFKPTVGCRLPGAGKAEGRFLVLILEKIVLWGPAIRGSWLAGWLANSSHGAMEAVRRIRRVRFCMHFCMAVDSVMKLNFTAPGSHLELRRASSRSTY